MEGQCAVQHHHDNAGDGHHCANIHPFAQLLPPTGEKLCQDHRDDGGHGHENAHIGGRGVGRSGILQEKVDAAAGDADENEHQLILPRELQRLRTQRPQSQVGKTHTQGDDLDGGKGIEHHLGQHKTAAPYQGGEQGKQVPRDLLVSGRADFRHSRSLSSS